MSTKSWLISRRRFLRGGRAALGLPLLEAMGRLVPQASAAASGVNTAGSVQAPVRMAALYFPNGVWGLDWFPKKDGADYEMPASLKPLEAHRQNLLVFSGLDKKHSHQGDGHYAKTANFLTGLAVKKTTGKDLSVGGQSLDQLCAQQIGHLTPLPSLELGIDPVISGIDSIVGFTRLYGSYISWQSPSQPMAREINPRLAWERLFNVIRSQQNRHSLKLDDRTSGDRQALLDLVYDDAKDLRRKLGRDDQFKLDEYLNSVREVEKRLEFFTKADPRAWQPPTRPEHLHTAAAPGEPGDHQAHVRLMLDMMVLAFQTDSTRLSTFMFANDVSGKNFGRLMPGTEGSHHEFSHHQLNPEKYKPYALINQWHTAQLAYFLDKLAAIKEGERTLLENSMILFGSSISDGNSHQPDNLPIVLAGTAGGTIKSGRHIASEKGTPLCNLYLSMLDRMGTPVEAFGDSTARMALS